MTGSKKKERLDKLMFAQGLAESREQARRLILAGLVIVDERKIDKAGTPVAEEAHIRVLGREHNYVGRGGLKLEKALEEFQIDPAGRVAIDIGASTGGFTDCLLQRGARKVYAVDVGYGQLAWKLVRDPRVFNRERTNIRHLAPEDIEEQFDLATIDLAFISLTKILEHVSWLLKAGAEVVALVKPQFEVGRGAVGKGGIVKATEQHQQVLQKVGDYAEAVGFVLGGVVESPIKGAKGNTEFLMYLRWKFSDDL
ncbi:TlyA family rRNA (cytidine-2'-O)-methyltransferase [candidate division KSB3 bacterium]|uniref:TlyA family rRNA (Cytidine-2'-O)-methyltransferase n=1 Tax=candidate division KSB3 bacterium TaxID=2044937 RepID=A0A2G6E9A2_9BACT|nr:MAG: TlyA family rRNA (cytidine-2'-O)-methyltransferase [candidate division KSB3 bacterium]PIE29598.1 MAG: TlyA family rRNA (cytidine-2'-O)-methyltransferase [candidate division KSB3 bacterium]